MIGSTLGNYRILERVGDGGMGAVYRAVDEMLDREVAIKVLKPELARQAALIERFRQEAIALARLNHPRIATLHGLERHGDVLLMIMEFVRGSTLEGIVERSGRLAWARAAELCAAVLDALDHAHDHGVVHRDIKPANIMLTHHGAVKVMDFGIARMMGRSRQTQLGHAVGTPMYMAPEQLRGEEVDGRTDLYATGAVLFELVTGRLAFEADSDYQLMMKQLHETPPPVRSIVGDEIPPELDAIIQRAMAKTRDGRFPNAVAFRVALEQCIAAAGAGARRGATPPTRLGERAPATTREPERGSDDKRGDAAPPAAGAPHAAAPHASDGMAPTAEHDVTQGEAVAAETRLAPPLPGTPGETRLGAGGGAPLTPPPTRLGIGDAGHPTLAPAHQSPADLHWSRDWRSYLAAAALLLAIGIAARSFRSEPGRSASGGDSVPGAQIATADTIAPHSATFQGVVPPAGNNQRPEQPTPSTLPPREPVRDDGARRDDSEARTVRPIQGSGTPATPPPVRGRAAPQRESVAPADTQPAQRNERPPSPSADDPPRRNTAEAEGANSTSEAATAAAITDVLSAFAAAVSAKRADAIEGVLRADPATTLVWTTLTREGRLSMRLAGQPAIQARGARATASFDAAMSVRSPFGATTRTSLRFSAELARSGDSWRIVTLHPSGALPMK